jgi:hypothetical protein
VGVGMSHVPGTSGFAYGFLENKVSVFTMKLISLQRNELETAVKFREFLTVKFWLQGGKEVTFKAATSYYIFKSFSGIG